MNKLYLLLMLLLIVFFQANATTRSMEITCTGNDALLYVDGEKIGNLPQKVTFRTNVCKTIRIEKAGFLSIEQTYCNKNGETRPPYKQYYKLVVDDSYNASLQTDVANVDISQIIRKGLDKEKSWKKIYQIVLIYFDVIEFTDKEVGYLRTAWEIQSFTGNTIRTRVIIKLTKSDPLTYGIKIISEESDESGTSVKSDEKFREWDRILKKYGNLVTDFQFSLKEK